MNKGLNIRCVMSKDKLPVGTVQQSVYGLLDLKAGGEAAVMPANIGLVLDRSGSMDGEKMEHLKEAVGYVVDRLGSRDRISITIFDDQVETVVPGRAVDNRDEIKAVLAKIIARGGTQISDGLRAGIAEVKKHAGADRVNRLLLLTDGKTWDDEEACLRLADEAGKQGIAITSIGLGTEWNEQLLLSIAEKSRGDSHWIQNPIAILDVFRQELSGMQSVAATNLTVTARFGPDVQPLKIYSTVPMIADITTTALNGKNALARLGTLDGKRGQALLFEVTVPPGREGRFQIGQVEVTYDVPAQGLRAQRATGEFQVLFTKDAAAAARVNAEVMNLAEKVSAFKLQTRALTEAAAGNIAAATRKLQAAATVLLDLGEEELAETAEREISALKKTGVLSAAGTKKLEYGTRKLTQALTEAIK